MTALLFVFSLLAFADNSLRCREAGEKLDLHLANQKKLQIRKSDLEKKLKTALQEEITAQVEKRDTSQETGAARAIYYELRNSRMESERWSKMIDGLRIENCDFCQKAGIWTETIGALCERCPQAKPCLEKGAQ